MAFPRMNYEYNYELNNYTYTQTMDTMLMPSYIVGTTIKNPGKVESIFGHFEGKDTTNGIRFWQSYRRGNTYIAHNGANYFLTNDFALALSLSKGKASTQVSDPMASLISNKPVYSYFNLNLSKYPAPLTAYMKESMGRRTFTNFETGIKIFDYAELIGDGTHQTLDIYLVDKQSNCLNTFILTANKLYVDRDKYDRYESYDRYQDSDVQVEEAPAVIERVR